MATSFKAACIQVRATPDVHENLRDSLALTHEAGAAGARLICLPEYFSGLRTEGPRLVPSAFPEGEHPAIPAFAKAARACDAWILLGSLGITQADGRVLNRSYVIDAAGRIAARYDKIHLFDVDLGAGMVYRESETIAPGHEAVVAATPWGGLGLSICYDVRFPHLYRALAQAGAAMLAVPAAFTRLTGRAHWHALNRARAIENGAYVLAPCQYGSLAGGGECYGHSLIVDPWGQVLADSGEERGYILAEIDPSAAERARQRIPSLAQDRPFTVRAPAMADERSVARSKAG